MIIRNLHPKHYSLPDNPPPPLPLSPVKDNPVLSSAVNDTTKPIAETAREIFRETVS